MERLSQSKIERSTSRRLLLDTNLLVLLIVGSHDRSLVSRHKRTVQYTTEDFDLLLELVGGYDELLVTPNILTETSNLLRQIRAPLDSQLTEVLGTWINQPIMRENYVASANASGVEEFPRLGLTDAGILELLSGPVPFLTDDLDLYVAVSTKHPNLVANFNHLRKLP